MKPLKFMPYTCHSIRPTGWLKRQLEIQAEGLSGNLHKIWPDIRDSQYIGGDRDGWERVPYWLDGLIPLAYLLEREDLKEVCKRYIDAIISYQDEDGWICPCEKDKRGEYDVWAVFLVSKVLVNYYECSKDERIPEVVEKALKQLNNHIDDYPIFHYWGKTRWYETLIAIYWLMERKEEPWQLELAHKLAHQAYDFEEFRKHWEYDQFKKSSEFVHVVNVAMSLKGPALYSRVAEKDMTQQSYKMMATLDEYHSMPTGHFTGDEHLGGSSPLRGSELCSVAEAMFSYENLIQLTGDYVWSDRLERLAYNALPATNSKDMWTHQYDQMTNQVQCTRFKKGKQTFTTNPEDSHLFGLEPNFGCCTANFNQGYPKFALSGFMHTDQGIVASAIMPSKLTTSIDGVDVRVECITDYPFSDEVTYKIDCDAPVSFTFYVKRPGYMDEVFIEGELVEEAGYYPITKTFHKDEITMTFNTGVKVVKRPSGMVAIKRGALTFSIPVKTKWVPIEYTKDGVERKFPYCDYELLPESPWNYGLAGDCEFTTQFHEVSDMPFDPAHPPVTIEAEFYEIPWKFKNGAPEAVPKKAEPIGEKQRLVMQPYGLTDLRLTEMPIIK